MTPARLNATIDSLVMAYLCSAGTASDMAHGSGLGSKLAGTGAAYYAGLLPAVLSDLIDDGDLVALRMLTRPFEQVIAITDAATWSRQTFAPILMQLGYLASKDNLPSVTNLDQWLSYYNCTAGTKWQALQHYKLADFSVFPISKENLFFPVKQGATYANGLGRLVVGTGYTDGFAVDESKYAGGFPKIVVSGISGSGLVTVTGTAFNPATKLFETGRTWTVTASANTSYTLSPGTAPVNSLIANVTGISVAAGITAGTIYAEAHEPAGRQVTP